MSLLGEIQSTLIDLIDKNKFPKILWNILFDFYCWIMYKFPQFLRRITCHIKGCVIKGGYGGFNLPEEAYCFYCERCGASESNYEETSKHCLIEKRDVN